MPRTAPRRRRRVPIESLERRTLCAAASFASAVSFAAGTAPVALAAADFNADGNADLAVADATAQVVNVFLGTGTGTFTAGPVLPLTAPPTAILTGDFNGDGKPDVAVAAAASGVTGSSVTVFLNTTVAGGTPTFGLGQRTMIDATSGTTDPVAVAAADLNGDGHLDLVATDYADAAVTVLLGTGAGTFAAPAVFDVGADPTAVAVADFNGDGHPDVAVANTLNAATGTSAGSDADGVAILLGSGTGQFTAGPITPLSASGSTALAAADLTGTAGRVDLAVGNADGTVTTLANDGTGAFTATADPSVGAGVTAVAVADLNLDGTADVVTADGGTPFASGTDAVTVLPGAGRGADGAAAQFAVGSLPTDVVVADFNNDGKPDVATADEGGGTVSVLLNDTVVTPVQTTSALAVSPTTAPAGQPVTLTDTVTPAAASPLAGESVPTGAVTFYDGSTAIGTATPVPGAGVATATLAVATLAAGSHRVTARYAGDVAYAASGTAATTVVVAPTATSGPDLVPSIVSVDLPATVAPGETGSVKVKLANHGNAVAAGTFTDDLFLSLDTTLDGGDTAVAVRGSLARAGVKLAAGSSVTLTGTFTVPATIPLGSYVLLAEADANGGLAESNAANDVAASPTAYTVADQFGTVGGRRGVGLAVTAGGGTAVEGNVGSLPTGTFRLTGPGTGTVDQTDDGADLTLAGTTAATVVTIAGGLPLHDLTAGAPVGTIRAAATAVNGTLTLGGGANTLALGDLSGATLTAAGGIRSLTVANWSAGSLAAPWVTTLRSAAAFGPTVTLSGVGAPRGVTLASFTVAAADSAAVTAAAGTVGAVLVRGDLSGTLDLTTGLTLATVRVQGGLTGTVTVDAGIIKSIATFGTVAAGVRFTAVAFPARAVLGGSTVTPTADGHFQLAVVAG